MTKRQLMIAAVILAILFHFGVTHAQQSNNTSENTQAADDARRAKAFDLLVSLAGQISMLQSAENRARLGSNIAESIWDHDEKLARTLLISVETDINAGLLIPQDGDPTEARLSEVFLQLRLDTVRRIAKHDADLALAFLKATEIPQDPTRPYDVTRMDRVLELQLAKEMAADNPEIALKLGRKSLARGFSEDLLAVLSKLRRKHREQALVLYKEIVSKLRSADLVRDSNALYFAQNLARSFTPPAADDLTFRDLINLFITAALANGCGAKMNEEDPRVEFCGQIGSLVPQMEKVDPARAARLKQWAPDADSSGWSSEAENELNDLFENGTVDDILALQAKYPQMEAEITWRAWMKAQSSGDIEQARKIATDYRGNPDMRREMLAQLDHLQEWASVKDAKLEEVQHALTTMPRVSDQVTLLLAVANQVGATDQKKALKLLNQASGLVDTMKPGGEQTRGQMALAAMFCSLKSDRGLALMESLVPKMNELVAAAVKLDGYDHHYLRDGEWNMSGEGGVGNLLTWLSQNAAYFAWCDFDRAVTDAGQFERPEIRLMAQLKLAQGILAGPPKRPVMGAPSMPY
jgi:hypothetical protein